MRTLTTSRFSGWLAVLLVALLAAAAPLSAAPAGLLSNTTLNGAITSSATTLVLGSASASSGSSFGAPAAGQCLWVENELMRITAISSTTATVTRATRGAAPHANSAVILTGPCNQFHQTDPIAPGNGNVDCTQFVIPWVNTNDADTWWCDQVLNKWTVTNYVIRTFNSVRVAQ